MVHSSSGDFWTLLGTVLYPFLAIWRLISNFLFSNPPAQTSVRTASVESSNLASSCCNSEKRHFLHLQNMLVMLNGLFKMKNFVVDTLIFFLYKGEKNQHDLNLYYITSWELSTWVYSAIFLKPIPWKVTSLLLILLFHVLNSFHPITKSSFFSGLNSNIFLTSHVLSDKVFHSSSYSQSSCIITVARSLCSR